jgi:hypothetical protein
VLQPREEREHCPRRPPGKARAAGSGGANPLLCPPSTAACFGFAKKRWTSRSHFMQQIGEPQPFLQGGQSPLPPKVWRPPQASRR